MVFCYVCNEGKPLSERREISGEQLPTSAEIKRGIKTFIAPLCQDHEFDHEEIVVKRVVQNV